MVSNGSEEEPRVSVLITAFNRKSFLEYALYSVLNQTRKPLEVILVTNFEYDVKKFHVLNIKHLVRNGIVGDFLSLGVETARGDVILFLDDDDILMQDKVKIISEAFRDERVVYLHNDVRFIDELGRPINKIAFKTIDFNLSSISVRKKIIDTDFLRSVGSNTDVSMYLFALNSGGRILNTREKLTDYRIHALNTGKKASTNLDHLHSMLIQMQKFSEFFKDCKICKKYLNIKQKNESLIYLSADIESYTLRGLLNIYLRAMILLNFRAIVITTHNFISHYIRIYNSKPLDYY